jgi:Tfp pilus assembly protein PilO
MRVLDDETRRFGRMLHYGGLLMAVVCATIGYSLLHAPTVQAIADISAQIDEVQLSVRNAPLIHEQHQNVSEMLAQVEEQIAALEGRVPQDVDAGGFLTEVSRIAAEESFAIKNFQPEKPAIRDGYTELEVTLKGEGSFASVCTFAERLGKLTRLSKMKDLTVTGGEKVTDYPVSATLIIYCGLRGKETQANDAKTAKEVGRG